MTAIAVVHLVRQGNNPDAFASFIQAYRATTDESVPLWLVCKGFGEQGADLMLRNSSCVLALPDTGFDLGSYRRAAEIIESNYLLFMNSFSRPLVKGWLDRLHAAAKEHGMAGATGSLEGVTGAQFPNPHIRTNAFCIERKLFMALDMPEPQTKEEASTLEAGPNSITRQVIALGYEPVVVDADGFSWAIDKARDSLTFRWGGQGKLLVADNRTEHFANADMDERQHLQRLAWGMCE